MPSELLTNAAKHSGAHSASVTVLTEQYAGVQLLVTDDGRGGATLGGEGSGLRGLEERIRAMDGRLILSSPPGGPTMVTVQLPPGVRTRTDAASPGATAPEEPRESPAVLDREGH